MKTFTLAELEKLELKDIDIEACFGSIAQVHFVNLCRQNPDLKDELVNLIRSAFIHGMQALVDATRRDLHAQ